MTFYEFLMLWLLVGIAFVLVGLFFESMRGGK